MPEYPIAVALTLDMSRCTMQQLQMLMQQVKDELKRRKAAKETGG